MSAFGVPAPDAVGEPVPDPALPGPAPPADEAGLMERVLLATLAVTEADVTLDGPELAGLQEVAQRFHGTPISPDPVVAGLVQVILAARFGTLTCHAGVGQAIALRIAETLWDDASSQTRLRRLWDRLTEAVR